MRRLHAHPAATGLLFSLLAGIVTARQCYYPNGANSSDVACSDAENVHCCSSSSICLTNGYCLQQSPWPLGIARGSCTDSDWGSSCPQNCIDSKYNNLGGGESIIYLELTNNQYHYCCGSYVTDNNGTVGCYTDQSSFVVGDGELMYGYAGLENATLVNSSTTTDASTTSSATSTASSALDTTVPASSYCDDNSVKIGAGVGVPLGVVALMAVAWALWERRKGAKSNWAAVASGPVVAGGGDQSAAVAGGRDQSAGVTGGGDQSAGVVAGGDNYPYYQYQQPYTKMQGQGDQGDLQQARGPMAELQQARGPMAELQHTHPPWGPTAELHCPERPAEMMDSTHTRF